MARLIADLQLQITSMIKVRQTAVAKDVVQRRNMLNQEWELEKARLAELQKQKALCAEIAIALREEKRNRPTVLYTPTKEAYTFTLFPDVLPPPIPLPQMAFKVARPHYSQASPHPFRPSLDPTWHNSDDCNAAGGQSHPTHVEASNAAYMREDTDDSAPNSEPPPTGVEHPNETPTWLTDASTPRPSVTDAPPVPMASCPTSPSPTSHSDTAGADDGLVDNTPHSETDTPDLPCDIQPALQVKETATNIRERKDMPDGSMWRMIQAHETTDPAHKDDVYHIWHRPSTSHVWEIRFVIKPSRITDAHGVTVGLGLFSVKAYAIDEPVTYYDGPVVSKRMVEILRDTPSGKSFLHLTKHRAINGTLCKTGAQFSNDNKTGVNNLKIANNAMSPKSEYKGYHTLFAKHPIRPDTELTWSYGPRYWNTKFNPDTQDTPASIIYPNLTDPAPHAYETAHDPSPVAMLAYSISRSNKVIFIDEIYTAESKRGKKYARALINRMVTSNPEQSNVQLIVRKKARQQEEARLMYTVAYGFKVSTDSTLTLDKRKVKSNRTHQLHMVTTTQDLKAKTSPSPPVRITHDAARIQAPCMYDLYDELVEHHHTGDKADVDKILKQSHHILLAYEDPPNRELERQACEINEQVPKCWAMHDTWSDDDSYLTESDDEPTHPRMNNHSPQPTTPPDPMPNDPPAQHETPRCSICLEDMTGISGNPTGLRKPPADAWGRALCSNKCAHMMHYTCLAECLKHKANCCPGCRGTLSGSMTRMLGPIETPHTPPSPLCSHSDSGSGPRSSPRLGLRSGSRSRTCSRSRSRSRSPSPLPSRSRLPPPSPSRSDSPPTPHAPLSNDLPEWHIPDHTELYHAASPSCSRSPPPLPSRRC